MPYIIAVLFEEKQEESYIAIKLDGEEPEIVFTKGPNFTKTMGPYPVPYAEATFKKWSYIMVENPPEIRLDDKESISDAIAHLCKQDGATVRYCPENKV